ncbi:MAG: dihydrofolate reductase family protein [Streptosporangiaceae bacterium]|nr:dihydrofolate reductase family protein [Streptosporangiaceae bacterium]
MSKVIAGFSMSLDGFVADPDDGVEQVFRWYSAGGTDAEVMAGDHATGMTPEAAESIEEAGRGAGVLVTARRTFDIAHAWGGKHPMDVPMVVVTHRVPEEWVSREGSPFTFVTEGVPKAIDVAREIAGDKDVVVGAPSVTQQCLQLGLLDAIHIDLVPVVLGHGIRLFDHLTKPVELLVTEASGNPHVTHITYRIIK